MRKYIYAMVLAVCFGIIAWSIMVAMGIQFDNPTAVFLALVVAALGAKVGHSLAHKVSTKFGSVETMKSMRFFFVFIGLMNVARILGTQGQMFNLSLSNVISAVIGLTYIFIGLELHNLIKNHAQKIIILIYLQLLAYAITGFYSMISIFDSSIILIYAAAILINLWIISSIEKLAKKKKKA